MPAGHAPFQFTRRSKPFDLSALGPRIQNNETKRTANALYDELAASLLPGLGAQGTTGGQDKPAQLQPPRLSGLEIHAITNQTTFSQHQTLLTNATIHKTAEPGAQSDKGSDVLSHASLDIHPSTTSSSTGSASEDSSSSSDSNSDSDSESFDYEFERSRSPSPDPVPQPLTEDEIFGVPMSWIDMRCLQRLALVPSPPPSPPQRYSRYGRVVEVAATETTHSQDREQADMQYAQDQAYDTGDDA